jgi:PKD repeat protein
MVRKKVKRKGWDHHKPTKEVAALVIILLIAGYFLVFHQGITGSITGVPEANVDVEILEKIAVDGEASVIVLLHQDPNTASLEEKQQAIANNQEDVLRDLQLQEERGLIGIKEQEFELNHKFSTINAFAGTVTKDGLNKLKKDYHVSEIKMDKVITLFLDSSVPLINAKKINTINLNGTLLNGQDQTVCVVDTGVDYTHPHLGGCDTNEFLSADDDCRVIGGYNVADNSADPLDLNGHGTHVAGIVANNHSTYTGIAPGANIAAVKVFPGNSGATNESNVIAGIDWCVRNAANLSISVITLSLGDGTLNNVHCDTSSLAIAVNNAVDAGIIVDVASGNTGSSLGISAPSCASKVISVGATTDSDAVASYSNSAAILDVLAPGSSITSTIPPDNFGSKSGTSMSAPHVAGAAILIKQYLKEVHNQTLTPAEVELRLKKGVKINDTRNNLVFPRIDLLKSLQPTVTINPHGKNINVSNIVITATSDLAISTALIEVNNINLTMTLSNATYFIYNVTNLNYGENNYKIYVTDVAGITGVSEEGTIILEKMAPKVVFNFEDSYVATGSFILSVNVTDDLGVSSVNYTFSLENNSFNLVATNLNSTNTWETLLNLSLLSEGTWTVLATAWDTDGNYNSTESKQLTVDTTLPSLVAGTVTSGELYLNSSLKFNVNVSDSNLAIVIVASTHSGNLKNYTMLLVNETSYLHTINDTISIGNHSYQFYAKDFSENLATSESGSYLVINRAPDSVSITSPANSSAYDKDVAIDFTATATDPDQQTLTYSWDFGDGETSTDQNPSHAYTTAGNYSITVTASDGSKEITTFINIIINELVNDTDDSSDESTETPETPASSGSGGGGSGSSGSSSSGSDVDTESAVVTVNDNSDFEFPEIAGLDFDTVEEVTEEVIETTEEPVADSGFSLNLVGAAVGNFINKKKGVGIAVGTGLTLVVIAVSLYLILSRKHQTEMYGIEVARVVRKERKENNINKAKNFLAKMNVLARFNKKN